MTVANKSKLFSTYNALRAVADDTGIERKRLNRALGLAMAKEPRPYHTSTESCDCPDSYFHKGAGTVYKHRIARILTEVASEPALKPVRSAFEEPSR